MATKKIRVYASLSPEYMHEAGKNAGLSDAAADYFRCFTEIEIELDVNTEYGDVCGARIVQELST